MLTQRRFPARMRSVMKHPFLCISLLLGLACWGVSPLQAKDDDDKKLSRAEKRELKKKEKEEKRASKKKGKNNTSAESEDEDKDKKKVDKKAFIKFLKKTKLDTGKVATGSKMFLIASFSLSSVDGEDFVQEIQKIEPTLKRNKIAVLLINEGIEEGKELSKELKKLRIKLPAISKKTWEAELEKYSEDVGLELTYPTGLAWILLDNKGKPVSKEQGAGSFGSNTNLSQCFEIAEIKAPAAKKSKDEEAADSEDSSEGESEEPDTAAES